MRAAVESSDAELITLARGGDADALGWIFGRHVAAVTAVARAHARDPIAADDLVAEAFARTYRVLRSGGGPDVALRAYLYTAVRRLAAERARGESRVRSTALPEELDRAVPDGAADLDAFDREVIAKAYLALPERWRAVLWHMEVERMSPAAVAPILGISASGVSALAYRAREGLREQYLQQHVGTLAAAAPACRELAPLLGSYARGRTARRERKRVEAHLRTCARCTRVIAELRDAAHGLRAVVAPLVLGGLGLAALPALIGGEAAAASPAPVPSGGAADAGGGSDPAAGVTQGATAAGPAAGAAAGPAAGPAAVAAAGTAGTGAPAPLLQGFAVPVFGLALALGLGAIGTFTYAGTRAIEASASASPAAAPGAEPADATTPSAEPSPAATSAPSATPVASGPARLTVAVRTAEPLRPGTPGEVLLELGNAGGASLPVELRATLPPGVALDTSRVAGGEGWGCLAEGDAVVCTTEQVAGSSTSGLPVPVTVAADAGTALTVRVIVHEGGTLAAVGEADAADPLTASARRIG